MQEDPDMQITHLIPVMMFAATTACLSSSTATLQPLPESANDSSTEEPVKLAGFVELYSTEGTHLLSGGREILLSGVTDRMTAFGGLEVVVTGRFVSPGVFEVDGVARARPTAVAVADSRP
jgi:hypothetical protein